MPSEDRVKFRIFGASHSEETGVSIEGIRFGEAVDLNEVQRFLYFCNSHKGFKP